MHDCGNNTKVGRILKYEDSDLSSRKWKDQFCSFHKMSVVVGGR